MSPLLALAFAFVVYLLVRLLHLTAPAAPPLIYMKDQSSGFVQNILSLCPILHQPYVPPFLWGKSGHVQTIAYAKMGRVNIPVPSGVRHSKLLPDGATLTFDLYEPLAEHKTKESCCLLFCPGIGNSSESPYIRTLVHYAQKNGYISVVLNHLGALPDVSLTAPRIFTYGGTHELEAVHEELKQLYPNTGIILVGLSMGANIVVKYLGEMVSRQQEVLAAISMCQGYDIEHAVKFMEHWESMRRAYVYVMTANQKRIMRRNKHILFKDGEFKEEDVLSATKLDDLDEAYTRRRFGFNSLLDFYKDQSCSQYLEHVKVPLLLVNTEDDPLVPSPLLEYPRKAASELDNCIFITTKHGGHLGFFEQGFIRPKSLTWMDRLIVEFANAITALYQKDMLPKPSSDNLKIRSDHKPPAELNGFAKEKGKVASGVEVLTEHIDNLQVEQM